MKAKLADKGNWFRRIAGNSHRKLEWRAALGFPARFVTREARSADLIVIGRVQKHQVVGHQGRSIAGRGDSENGPPDARRFRRDVGSLRGEHIVIGWKDAREAPGKLCAMRFRFCSG